MQASRSLFLTAIKKIGNQPSRTNVITATTTTRTARPFLNIRSTSSSSSTSFSFDHHHHHHQTKTMSSATTISGGSSSSRTIYDFTVLDNKNQPYPLSRHRGQVVLIVNVASKCGFTPQYSGLEKLYQTIQSKYPSDKFTILGFPCNQFGGQEPGSNEEIQTFCTQNYGVTFPVLAKVDVNGDEKEDPLWAWLKREKSGFMGLKRVKWNFEKFLVGPDGRVVERWASTTTPDAIRPRVEEELKRAGVMPKDEGAPK